MTDPIDHRQRPVPNLILRSPTHWTAVGFFGGLALMHGLIAGTSLVQGRWEAHLSLIFAAAFALIAGVCWMGCREIAILPDRRRVRIRTGVGHLRSERMVQFDQVQRIRLTLQSNERESRIEMICDGESVDCPVTPVPRQQALCMAILIGVNLTKVMCDPAPEEPKVEMEQV